MSFVIWFHETPSRTLTQQLHMNVSLVEGHE